MDITWQVRNFRTPDYFKDTVEEKLQRLAKKLPLLTDARVELTQEHTRSRQNQIVAEVTLHGTNNVMLRAEERAADPLTGVEAAIHALDGRIRHLKGKLYRSETAHRLVRRAQPALEEPAAPEAEESGEDVVRVKRFVMRPMSVEDAILQMNLLGHDFFFFENSTNSEHAVVYRRRDGKYGLMEPAR